MYDKETYKQELKEHLRHKEHETVVHNRKENVKRSIEFAISEIDELEEAFHAFQAKVAHLVVYDQLMKEPFHKEVQTVIDSARTLIERNYSAEEKSALTYKALNQLEVTQKRRLEVLRNIARRYFHR